MKNLHKSVFIFLLFFSGYLLAGDIFVYVSLKGDNRLVIFKLDTLNGNLNLVEKFVVNGGPTVITIDQSKKYLYIAQGANKTISSFAIDQTTGKLTLLNTIPSTDDPVNLQFDKTNHFLFSAYYNANKASIHSVNLNGTLSNAVIRSFNTGAGSNPHAAMTDPSNKYLYVSNKSGEKIQRYLFNAVTGDISPTSLIEYITPARTGPRHFVFHSRLPLVYFANELGGSASVYSISQANGILTHLQTITTLPAGFSGINTVADIHMTPDEKFLYVSNRGHNSIAAFRLNPVSGLLSSISQYATVTTPRAFNIDPSGNFLFAAGQTSGNMATYRINQITGVLTLIGNYLPVGKSPEWITVAEYNKVVTGLTPEESILYPSFTFSPNPYTAGSAFKFQLGSPQKVDIYVYNSTGTIVKSFTEKELNAGHHSLLWDGTDNSSVRVSSGVYTAMFYGNGSVSHARLIVP